jgi:hypothetical protein
VNAAAVACPVGNYLPDAAANPVATAASLTGNRYLRVGELYYKVNEVSGEALVVAYNKAFTGALTVPENLAITATVIDAAGFNSADVSCSRFAKTYKVRYLAPSSLSALYNGNHPVVSAITLEAQIKAIGTSALEGQCKVETLVIPDSVTHIGMGAFLGMNASDSRTNTNCDPALGLETITLGVNLKALFNSTFTYSRNIKSTMRTIYYIRSNCRYF